MRSKTGSVRRLAASLLVAALTGCGMDTDGLDANARAATVTPNDVAGTIQIQTARGAPLAVAECRALWAYHANGFDSCVSTLVHAQMTLFCGETSQLECAARVSTPATVYCKTVALWFESMPEELNRQNQLCSQLLEVRSPAPSPQ
jgi:hypothetical protein